MGYQLGGQDSLFRRGGVEKNGEEWGCSSTIALLIPIVKKEKGSQKQGNARTDGKKKLPIQRRKGRHEKSICRHDDSTWENESKLDKTIVLEDVCENSGGKNNVPKSRRAS